MSKENQQKLLQLLEEMREDTSKEKIRALVQILEQCSLFVPAVLPPNTDPKIIKKLAESNGKSVDIPKENAPKPLFLENKEQQKFLPLFTSKEQSEKGPQRAPIHLGMAFKACLNILTREPNVIGIVVNPYDHNVVIKATVTKNAKSDGTEMKLTEAQMHAVMRQRVEAELLPNKLFAEKESMIEALKNDLGNTMLAMYKEVYQEQATCPYDSEEFDSMALNIRDDLTVIRITMPEQKMGPGICPMVLVSWNPEKEEIRYFGIVKGSTGDPAHIIEALPNGKKTDLGEAPAEGSEFQYIIDLNTPS